MLYLLALVPGGTALFLWWWHLAWIVVVLAAALYLPLFALQKWGVLTARWRSAPPFLQVLRRHDEERLMKHVVFCASYLHHSTFERRAGVWAVARFSSGCS